MTVRLNKQKFEMVGITGETDRLKEHPDNPKRGDVDAIKESMEINGFFGAVVAQKSTGYVLAGNHTFRTAAAEGVDRIPVLWIDVDDDAALRILLADNKIAELGFMDEEALDAALSKLDGLAGTGYSGVEDAIREEENREPEPEPDPGPPTADDVPDDDFVSQFGVVIVCTDQEQQEAVFAALQAMMEGTYQDAVAVPELLDAQLRVVAI